MTALLEKFRRDITGIMWAAGTLFLALALASYHPTDPSLNSVARGPSTALVQNLCGYFGSFLSDLLYQLLGIAAWVFVLGSSVMSSRAFRGKPLMFQTWRFVCAGLLLLTAAALCSLYF